MCLTPINLKKETWMQKIRVSYHMQQVPCGRCLECLKLRVNSWYIRLLNEKNSSLNALFVTLTYSDDNLRFSDNGNMSLDYRDTQLFWKRLRKAHPKDSPKIKYFLVGEYGTKTHRPHYHAIVFNCNPDLIQKAWGLGQIHIGNAKEGSIYYTLKYALKRVGKWSKSDEDDRNVEKALMSRGLGLNFLTDDMVAFYQADVSRPVTLLDGQKLPLPRYYRDKLYNQKQKLKRNRILIKFEEKRYEKTSDKLFPQRVKKMLKDTEKKINKTD